MSAPERIQRKRTKGWRMPEGAVYVGRPTVYGNPWTMQDAIHWGVEPGIERYEFLVKRYRRDLDWFGGVASVNWDRGIDTQEVIQRLRGRDLACWCPLDVPCHADVLLELANQEATP